MRLCFDNTLIAVPNGLTLEWATGESIAAAALQLESLWARPTGDPDLNSFDRLLEVRRRGAVGVARGRSTSHAHRDRFFCSGGVL